MSKVVNHEVTLILFETDNETGEPLVYDIIETNRRYASHFCRRAYRNPVVTHIVAVAPNGRKNPERATAMLREIQR